MPNTNPKWEAAMLEFARKHAAAIAAGDAIELIYISMGSSSRYNRNEIREILGLES